VSALEALAGETAAPDLIAPLVGFRNWRVIDGVLSSPYAPLSWREPVVCARCLRERHRAPAPGCDCGISAYHEPDLRFSSVDFRGVSGIVSVWGHVEVHEDRLRAEYARVEALAMHPRWSMRQRHAVTAVAAELGAELVDLREQAEAARAYGCQMPSACSASRYEP
jgi:hypothetical protein